MSEEEHECPTKDVGCCHGYRIFECPEGCYEDHLRSIGEIVGEGGKGMSEFIIFNCRPGEKRLIARLAKRQNLSEEQLIRQALRLYQSTVEPTPVTTKEEWVI